MRLHYTLVEQVRAREAEHGGRGVSEYAAEVSSGRRFEFGRNWARFLKILSEERVRAAERSLTTMLHEERLAGKRFLDVGSGSGLFSLAARRLGAYVRSFDYDPLSVACTQELRRRYFPNDPLWKVEQASVLDKAYLASLGQFDVVYSWGVLHHSGAMWQALAQLLPLVGNGGKLCVAIYNDQGWISRYWRIVKRGYNRDPLSRALMVLIHAPYLLAGRWLMRALTGRLALERGMSLWYDMRDWLGGYPFEVAKPEDIFDFLSSKGFTLTRLHTCGGRHGCNEFVFRR